MYAHFFKRIIDFLIALVALLLISPVLLIITILLYVFNEGAGAFFLQERPGLHGKIFKIIKFKTMNERRDVSGKLLPDVQRITKFGRFVRNTSLDELPQLINVLKGDMALIGPRPLLVNFVGVFSKVEMGGVDVGGGFWGCCGLCVDVYVFLYIFL